MDTIISIINQIHITPAQGQMIIGAIPVVMFGMVAKMVWDTITNVGKR